MFRKWINNYRQEQNMGGDMNNFFRVVFLLLALIYNILFAIPLVIDLILVYVKSRNAKKVDTVRSEIAKIVGNSKFIHIEKDTAIALNLDQKEVLLGKPGLMKNYTYADIREWTVKEQVAGTAVGIGVMGSIAVAGSNSSAQQDAMANTGLFIRVKDIDHPEWRVSMFQKADRNRWFEILTQEINEGGVAA
jgi:hypothetical protein